MTYSCAIFDQLDTDLKQDSQSTRSQSPDTTLKKSTSLLFSELGSMDGVLHSISGDSTPTLADEDELYDAQIRKLKFIIDKCDIRPGQKVGFMYWLPSRSFTKSFIGS